MKRKPPAVRGKATIRTSGPRMINSGKTPGRAGLIRKWAKERKKFKVKFIILSKMMYFITLMYGRQMPAVFFITE